jgi:hypothetical protein
LAETRVDFFAGCLTDFFADFDFVLDAFDAFFVDSVVDALVGCSPDAVCPVDSALVRTPVF